MSKEIIINQINKFLNSNTSEILCIRGEWATGKTYLWNKLIQDAERNKKIKLKKYSYVSLFGINTLKQLKLSIFEQIIETNMIGRFHNIESLKNKTSSLLKSLGTKWGLFTKCLPGAKNFAPIIESLAFLYVSDAIICIDDFERKGEDLTVNDILGLISYLKLQQNCKVVLIFNESKLNEKDRNIYKEFSEKVIDIDLSFSPTSEEICDIALDPSEWYEDLKNFAINLKIINIRILKNIERFSNDFYQLLSEYNPIIFKNSLHSLCLFMWIQYSQSTTLSLEDLKDFNFISKSDDSNERSPVKEIIRNYGFLGIDDFDMVVIDAIKNGYINEKKLKIEASRLNNQIDISEGSKTYIETYSELFNDFTVDESKFSNNICDEFKKCCAYLTPYDLQRTVELLRRLLKSTEADELIRTYIEKNKGNKELFNLNQPFYFEIKDQKIISEFENVYTSFKKEKTQEQIMEDIKLLSEYPREIKDYLKKMSSEDYLKLFKETKGKELRNIINNFLKLNLQNATNALQELANESALNKVRLESFDLNRSKKINP